MLSYLYVAAAVMLRLIPHPWNLTPMGAMFLFSGATFARKRDSLLAPMAALLISDFAVNAVLYQGRFGWWHPSQWAGFLAVGLIGWTLRGRISVLRVAGASLAGSVAFFLISNFGVWTGWTMYPPTFDGLIACYAAALPFFRQTVIGDAAYAALMFGSWHWLRRRLPHRVDLISAS